MLIIVYVSNLAPPLGELAPPLAVTERAKDFATPPPSRHSAAHIIIV